MTQKLIFKVGDHVHFFRSVFNSIEMVPSLVLRVHKKRIRIRANFPEGDRAVWVSPKNCKLQK